MAETPRKNREKLIMQWYEKRLNRDELLRVLEGSKSLDENVKTKIEKEILENFYENFEKAKENKKFKSADAQYMGIKKTERQVVKKDKELIKTKKSTKKELEEIEDEKFEIGLESMDLEDGSWWKKGKLMKANTRRDELTKQEKQINGKINELHREKQVLLSSLGKMYENYGPKFKRSYNKGKTLGGMSKIQEGLNSETTYKGYREKYFEVVKAKEEYIQNFLSEMRGLDLGISEDKKQEILETIESNMKKEIEDLGDDIVKEADRIEKWLENDWKDEMQKLLDLSGEIEKQESKIKDTESEEKSATIDEILEIKEKEFELKKNLLETKNEYESMKNKISEDLKNYDGLAVDWTKPILVETWEERIKREKIEEEEIKENTIKLLKKYREAWKKMVDISTDTKDKIMKVSEKIPVKIDVDQDGSRLIELKIGNKRYNILDPILDKHTDTSEYYSCAHSRGGMILKKIRAHVYLRGMKGNDVDKRENEPLRKYVKQKENEGLHIASLQEIQELLNNLGDIIGSTDDESQVAMLMYLTGLDGGYWLADCWPSDITSCYRSGIMFHERPQLNVKDLGDSRRLNLLMMSVTES